MGDHAGRAELYFDAVIFDMDGVVTRTANLHAAAWKELFDDFLSARVAEGDAGFRPFDPAADYLAYVDGRPRLDGVRRFLAARGVQLREGEPTDGPQAMAVHGLGARKDAVFVGRMRDGIEVLASTVALVRRLARARSEDGGRDVQPKRP